MNRRVGLSDEAAFELVPELNAHLAVACFLLHRYYARRWTLTEGRAALYTAFARSLWRSLDDLAGRVAALGGEPMADLAEQFNACYLDLNTVTSGAHHDLVALDLALERRTLAELRYSTLAAADREDFATERLLKRLISESEDRVVRLARQLEA